MSGTKRTQWSPQSPEDYLGFLQQRNEQIVIHPRGGKDREEEEEKMADFSEEDMLRKAMLDVERTNKRVMLMRKRVKRLLIRT